MTAEEGRACDQRRAVTSYIHAGGKIGVLLEVNCESDFVARTDDFKNLVHDIAMHIAAVDPRFIRKEDVTPEAFEKEKDIYRAQACERQARPVVEKIVEGKMGKFYEEVCLLEQPFIKDQTITIVAVDRRRRRQARREHLVTRFARFKVGDVTRRSPSQAAGGSRRRVRPQSAKQSQQGPAKSRA